MREFFRREAVQPQIDSNRFTDLYPHPELPITDDMFNEFDSLVTNINEHLGIGNCDGYCAYSEGRGNEPEILISRHENFDENPNKVRVFDVRVGISGRTTKILICNDAGTTLNPWQIGGNQITVRQDGVVLYPKRILTDPMLGGLNHLIKQRLEERPFRKKPFLGFI